MIIQCHHHHGYHCQVCKACSSHNTPIIPDCTDTHHCHHEMIIYIMVMYIIDRCARLAVHIAPQSFPTAPALVWRGASRHCRWYSHHGHHPIPNHHHLQGGVCVNVARNMGKVVKNELISMIITIASSERWIRWSTSLKRISLLWSNLGWTGKPLMQRSGKLTTIFVIDDWWWRLWCCWWF